MLGATGTSVEISVGQRNLHELNEVVERVAPHERLVGDRTPSDEGLDVSDLGVGGGCISPLGVEDVLPDLAE